MARFKAIAPEAATGRTRELLDAVHVKLGLVPNMLRALATAPAVLEGYLSLSEALEQGSLSLRTREQLALAVSQANACEYCVAAHMAIGASVGLTADQIRDSRLGTAVDSRVRTLIRFARRLVEAHGRVTDRDLAAVHAAGFNDSAIAEVVAQVALNIFANYFTHVSKTELDFPPPEALTSMTTSV